jgi:hypothetical protein
MSVPPDLPVFQAALAKARENPSLTNPSLGQEVRLSQYIVPTAADEAKRARQLPTRVNVDPDLPNIPQIEDASSPLTLSPKNKSPRFSNEWYATTEHLQPGPDRKPRPKLQVQKAASEGKKD